MRIALIAAQQNEPDEIYSEEPAKVSEGSGCSASLSERKGDKPRCLIEYIRQIILLWLSA